MRHIETSFMLISVINAYYAEYDRSKIVHVFLYIELNIFLGAQRNPLIKEYSFEYPQYVFRLRKKSTLNYALLPKGLFENNYELNN